MKRINYLVSWSERHFGLAPSGATFVRGRPALVACAVSLALMGTLWAVEATRLRAAELAGATSAERLAAGAADVTHAQLVARDVQRLRDLHDRIAAIRRTGADRAAEIAALGDRLPAEAWLTALHTDRSALMLEGRSARLSTVGSAISALARLPAYGAARLVAIHADPRRPGVTYSIALESRR